MRYASFTVQTGVYFRKLRRIASKERYWKFIIFAFVISFTVGAVVGGDMFTNYESTKSGFFSFTSAAIWIGIFNSIQSICREHEIIRSEYRSGMRLGAYVTAHALWQLLICAVRSGIISVAGMIFAYGTAAVCGCGHDGADDLGGGLGRHGCNDGNALRADTSADNERSTV